MRSPLPRFSNLVVALIAAVPLVLLAPPVHAAACVELGAADPEVAELGPRVVAVLERILSRDAGGLSRLATPAFRQGVRADRLQNDLDRAAARGQAVAHLEELRIWRVDGSTDGEWIDCAGGPRVQGTGTAPSLLAIAEGPRQGAPGRGRVALMLQGEALALDYLHLSSASLGPRDSAAFLAEGSDALAAGHTGLAHLLLGLAREHSHAGPRVELQVDRQARAARSGLVHDLPAGSPQTWRAGDDSLRVFRLATWPLSPFEAALLLEYASADAEDARIVAQEADHLAAALAARHPALGTHFERVVLAPRSDIPGPEVDPAAEQVEPATVRRIPWSTAQDGATP